MEQNNKLYSIRMRASKNDRHISGAERIVCHNEIQDVSADLITRALTHEIGSPDSIIVTIDTVDAETTHNIITLPFCTVSVSTVKEAHEVASAILEDSGISRKVAERALTILKNGPGEGGTNMRGAIIMDSQTSERLEPDCSRGIRASRMDMTKEARKILMERLAQVGLGKRFKCISESLILASKVVGATETIAELCWSDDPGNVNGYVATKKHGYVRIPHMKEPNLPIGGRVFFVDSDIDLESYISKIEKMTVIVSGVSEVGAEQPLGHILGLSLT